MKAPIVSPIIQPSSGKRTSSFIFYVKNGNRVDIHRYSTREEAVTARTEILTAFRESRTVTAAELKDALARAVADTP